MTNRLTSFLLLGVLVLGAGFGAGLGLSEAPSRSVPVAVAKSTPGPGSDRLYVAVWMQPWASPPQARGVKAALARIPTVHGCAILTVANIGQSVVPGASGPFIASEHPPNVRCFLPKFTAPVRSGLSALDRVAGVAALAVSFVGRTPSTGAPGRWVATG